MSWNGFSKHIRNSTMNRPKTNSEKERSSISTDDRKTIWIRAPYLSEKGELLSKYCVKKIRWCLKEDVKFDTLYDTKKISMFSSSKNKIPINQKVNIVS